MENEDRTANFEQNLNKTNQIPLVSVNICTYNRENLIEKAIKSALMQDYSNIEIIVSDSGSDDTEAVVLRLIEQNPNAQIKYFKNDTKGISANRNYALSRSEGKYIAVLDSDDYWISGDKISKQVRFLEENPNHILVGTNAVIVDSDNKQIGKIENEINDEEIREKFLLKNHFVHSSVMFRKDPIKRYDEEIFIWEDYELFLTLAQKNKVANLPEFMTAYKKHDTNVSSKNKIKGVSTLNKIIRRNKKYYPNYLKAEIKNFFRLVRAIF